MIFTGTRSDKHCCSAEQLYAVRGLAPQMAPIWNRVDRAKLYCHLQGELTGEKLERTVADISGVA